MYLVYEPRTLLSGQASGGISRLLGCICDFASSHDYKTVLISRCASFSLANTNGSISLSGLAVSCILNALCYFASCKKRFISARKIVIVFGCSSYWQYLNALVLSLLGFKVYWHPCYHPPYAVRNKFSSRLAFCGMFVVNLLTLRQIIFLCLTPEEVSIFSSLGLARLSHTLLPPETLSTPGFNYEQFSEREYLYCFLGRPVAQKGWDLFLQHVQQTQSSICCAVVPFPPDDCLSVELIQSGKLFIQLAIPDSEVQSVLSNCKVLLLPADYESLGIAQIEAAACGCFVPVLGAWPFWDKSISSCTLNLFSDLQTSVSCIDSDSDYSSQLDRRMYLAGQLQRRYVLERINAKLHADSLFSLFT